MKVEPELREVLKTTKSLTEAAKKLGISTAAISLRLKRRGIKDVAMYLSQLKNGVDV